LSLLNQLSVISFMQVIQGYMNTQNFNNICEGIYMFPAETGFAWFGEAVSVGITGTSSLTQQTDEAQSGALTSLQNKFAAAIVSNFSNIANRTVTNIFSNLTTNPNASAQIDDIKKLYIDSLSNALTYLANPSFNTYVDYANTNIPNAPYDLRYIAPITKNQALYVNNVVESILISSCSSVISIMSSLITNENLVQINSSTTLDVAGTPTLVEQAIPTLIGTLPNVGAIETAATATNISGFTFTQTFAAITNTIDATKSANRGGAASENEGGVGAIATDVGEDVASDYVVEGLGYICDAIGLALL
jgi:hypothetical protein